MFGVKTKDIWNHHLVLEGEQWNNSTSTFSLSGGDPLLGQLPTLWQNFPRNFNQFPSRIFRFLVSARHKSWERPLPTGFSPLPVVVWAKVVVRKVFLQGNPSLQGKESTQNIVNIETYPWNLHHYPTCWPCWGVIDHYWTIVFQEFFFHRFRGVIRLHGASRKTKGYSYWVDTPSFSGFQSRRNQQKPQHSRTTSSKDSFDNFLLVRSEIFFPDL